MSPSDAPNVPASHSTGDVEPAGHHEPRGHGREQLGLVSSTPSPTTPGGQRNSLPPTQYEPILQSTLSPKFGVLFETRGVQATAVIYAHPPSLCDMAQSGEQYLTSVPSPKSPVAYGCTISR